MHDTRKFAATVICAIALGSATVDAAVVSKQSGGVLINNGSGFVPIASAAELGPGKQVMVQPGGLASITYANNCLVRVGAGIWFVQASPPCADGVTEIDFTKRMNQQTENDPPPGIPPFVIGGAIVGVGVGIAVFLNKSSHDNPASP